MLKDILDIIIFSLEGSFLQVTVFVGAVLLLFGYINYKQSGNFIRAIERSKKYQPIIGALLGLTPGCGGAIIVMPLFVKGSVSFGTVIATLIATMGDSAFVIISTLPLHYLLVSVLSLIAAIFTGYVVDYYKIGDKLLANIKKRSKKEQDEINSKADHMLQNMVCNDIKGCGIDEYPHLGHDEGDDLDIALHHNTKGHEEIGTLAYKITHSSYILYWLIISVGLVLGVMLLFQVDVNALTIPNLGTILGVFGSLFSVIYMILSKKFLQGDTHEETELKTLSLKETLIHNAEETAFVGTWVFVAYLIYEISIYALGGADYAAGEALLTTFLTSTGLYAVIIGALIGLIPGCGPQIIFVALYAKGMVPFAALLANAISQDGDALFPLLAIDRRSSLWATIITTIPALILGLLIYFIEITYF